MCLSAARHLTLLTLSSLPHIILQVTVLFDNIPSSCRSKQCSFNFTEVLTPMVHTVSPTQGQGGTTITIQGISFGEDTDRLYVSIGGVECEVLVSDSASIECTAGRHAAGTYEVVVSVQGVGRALNSNGTCFTYLLTLNSITPSTGGVTGGYQVNITGEGFLDFTADSPPIVTAEQFSTAPWFQHGLGLPETLDLRHLRLCPDVREQFEDGLRFLVSCLLKHKERIAGNRLVFSSGEDACFLNSFSLFAQFFELLPAHVNIGGSLCIITEAAIDYIVCTAIVSSAGLKDVSVSIFDQQEALVDAFMVDAELTPIVESVSPLYGPVSGGTILTLTGRHFMTVSDPNITVTIDNAECTVQFANDSVVVCTTPPHRPAFSLVFVFTLSGGVAGLEPALSDVNHESSLFPVFEHRLSAGLLGGIPVGSLAGGTEVVIVGEFVNGKTAVYIGEKVAEVVSIQENAIVVLTPSSATIKDVYLGIVELRGQ